MLVLVLFASVVTGTPSKPMTEPASHKKWRLNNKDRVNELGRDWNKANPEKRKNAFLKNRFGITLEDYLAMFQRQGGVCAVCGNHETCRDSRNPTQIRALAVDHNHETGVVRGLLCHACNLGIGSLKDDPTLLAKAIAYLQGGGLS
jgi:hypothetical protein